MTAIPSTTAPRAWPDDAMGGVDEAGRGPLAGAVVAAVVVLAPGQYIDGVRDSKQLSAAQRSRLAAVIRARALGWATGRAEAAEIDELNILQATFLAMERALAALPQMPGRLLVDGNRAPRFAAFGGTVQTMVGGDRRCPAIAAASILAKTTRDADMLRLEQLYPGYGFAGHKGYPTARHREALLRLGPCPAHRRSYKPVQEAAVLHGGPS